MLAVGAMAEAEGVRATSPVAHSQERTIPGADEGRVGEKIDAAVEPVAAPGEYAAGHFAEHESAAPDARDEAASLAERGEGRNAPVPGELGVVEREGETPPAARDGRFSFSAGGGEMATAHKEFDVVEEGGICVGERGRAVSNCTCAVEREGGGFAQTAAGGNAAVPDR